MVRQRRLSLFGHVARMSDNVPTKAVLRVACDVRDGVRPSQTGADRGVVLPLPVCTRFVQTVACQLETPSTVPRIGPCGERIRNGLLGLELTTTLEANGLACSLPPLHYGRAQGMVRWVTKIVLLTRIMGH